MTKEQFETITELMNEIINNERRTVNHQTVTLSTQHKNPGEQNDGLSETIQGQAQTIKELLVRYNNGQTVPLNRNVNWAKDDGEEEIIIQDLTELDEHKQVLLELKESRDKLQKEETAKKRQLDIEEEAEKLDKERRAKLSDLSEKTP